MAPVEGSTGALAGEKQLAGGAANGESQSFSKHLPMSSSGQTTSDAHPALNGIGNPTLQETALSSQNAASNLSNPQTQIPFGSQQPTATPTTTSNTAATTTGQPPQQQQPAPLQAPPPLGGNSATVQQQQAAALSASLFGNQRTAADQVTAAALALALTGNGAAAANVSLLHNLIPAHLQPSALAPSLNGTPGHPSALIPSQQQQQQQAALAALAGNLNHAAALVPNPNLLGPLAAPAPIPLTVQDRPMTPPVYNGVNPSYPGLRVLNTSPPMFCVDNFLTPFECDFLVQVAQDSFGPAPVVGKGVGEISPSRTSSTCYLAREDLPDLLRKVSLLTGKPMDHCELPQVGRYFASQQYLQHFDAFDLGTQDGLRFAANGGQRTVTVLIYLNDCERGGGTRFPALNLEVQPRRGMALVFFPATVDGMLDKMALHAALPAIDTKYVSQCWIRQSTYTGQPSKRLPATMGVPFTQSENNPAFGNQPTPAPIQPFAQPPQQQAFAFPVAPPQPEPLSNHQPQQLQQQQPPY